MSNILNLLPPARKALLVALKRTGPAGVAELADRLELSAQAVRQTMTALERDGWVTGGEVDRSGAGRPATQYELTPAGEELFPKRYDDMVVALVDAVAGELGDAALFRVLSTLTDLRVGALAPALEGLSLDGRVEAMRNIYQADDPFIEVERARGGFRIIERNCPFLKVAQQRPALCSTTVTTLSRLLGRRVVRENRFQDGDGCCVFFVPAPPPREPTDFPFEIEP